MKIELKVEPVDQVVVLGTDLVFAQKPYWCNAGVYPLKMSIIRPRSFFYYDKPKQKLPVIVWLCGGGWTEIDPNVWIPELTYFAKRGYAVVSVSYSLSPTWVFPEPLMDVKAAIRYLRANAEELGIDEEKIAIMGESAGAHLAALAAVTGENPEYEKGAYLEYSSKVQTAVLWYPPIDMEDFEGRGETKSYDTVPQTLLRGELEPQSVLAGMHYVRKSPEMCKKMDPRYYVTSKTPPMMIMHGTADTQVPVSHSQKMYDTLCDAGVEADLLLVDGAEHADHRFIQPEVKDRILEFLNHHLK